MKVIFLDVDGVLNKDGDKQWTVSKKLIKNLKHLVDSTGAKIVVSSSWRNPRWSSWKDGIKDKNVDQPLDLLKKKLKKFKLDVFDVTPDLRGDAFINSIPRGLDIKTWLDAHPDVTNFVILDDVDDFFDNQKSHLVLTDYKVGLSNLDVILGIFILMD